MVKKLNLNGLNPNQRKAVETVTGPTQVNSVAGSGKTRVLTHRIAYMIKDCGIKPENILVATFTKKASLEMQERLQSLITKKALRELTIGTFHSIGYHILKNEYRIMNHPLKNFDLLQGAPLKWMIKECLEELKIKTSNTYNENLFAAEINTLKMQLLSPESSIAKFLTGEVTQHDQNIMAVYELYEVKKKKKNLIDFNDMLYKLYYLFLEYPNILKKYQDKIQYVLVDEAQDNNMAQYELIKMIAEPQNNIFIVGDDDQSIYKFRGAIPEQFINFKNDFDNVSVINLQENYRSLPYILETANCLIKHNTIRMQKELIPFRKPVDTEIEIPFYQEAENEDEEAKIVVEDIIKLENKGKSYNDMTILYRTNAQSRALEDELVGNGIPYIIANGISFYERTEIKDLISYLKLAYDTNDNEALKRIINKPSRYLGNKVINELEYIAKKRKCSLFDAINFIQLSVRQQNNINDFKSIINKVRNKIFTSNNLTKILSNNPAEILSDIISLTKYDELLIEENSDEEDNIKLENVNSLLKATSKFESVEKFLKYVDMVTNAKQDEDIPTVKLMTIHKSKGLEFPIVFIVGMSEGLLPHNNALKDFNSAAAIEEERRLAYVAITRAQDYLKVTYPMTYQGFYQGESRFIQEAKFIPMVSAAK